MNIGKAIKELRKQQGLSQAELAQSSNITQAALSHIENGKRPGTNTIINIANALNVSESLIYIMGMEKGDVPKQNQILYDELFPVIQGLVHKIGSK